jgi:hypothetical protein
MENPIALGYNVNCASHVCQLRGVLPATIPPGDIPEAVIGYFCLTRSF